MKKHFSILLVLFSSVALAREVWVPRAYAIGAPRYGCTQLRWRDDIVFLNTTDREQLVELLDSTGPRYSNLILPPHKQYSLRRNVQGETARGIWIDHLNLPDGVNLAARLGLGIEDSDCRYGAPPDLSPQLGEVSMPTFDALIAPGKPQTILGANLGAVSSRVTVTLFNAAESEAHFRVEFHGGCDDAAALPLTLSLASREVRQVSLGPPRAVCSMPHYADPMSSYVSVVSDQPSLSFVSVLPLEGEPTPGFAIVK